MFLPNILSPVFMFAFIFYCRSFSPCWPLAFFIFSPPLEFPCFSSNEFSITRSSSFSVIHVSVNIKNNAEKDTTLLLFFLSKSPGGHAISFQIKPWVAFGLLSYPMNPYALRTCALGPSCHVLTDLKLNGVEFSVFWYTNSWYITNWRRG